MILKSMDVRRRVGCGTIVCVVLVYGLVVVTSEGSRRALQSILGNGYDDVWMGEVDEHTVACDSVYNVVNAEQIWNNCWQEVMEMKDQVVDLNSYFLWEASGVFNEAISETALLRKKYWHAIFNSLSPDVKQSLLVCSRSAGYSSTTSWIAKYINMFHDRPHAQRRFLIRKPAVVPRGKRHQTVITPVSSPFGAPSPSPFRKLPLSSSATPSPSPLESPSPSPTLAPYSSSSPSPIFRPPAEAPVEPSPTAQLSLSPSVAVHPIPGLANKQHSQGPSASDDNDQHKKKVLIALIAMMSVAIIILAALLIYLLKNKKNKVGSRHEQKDDRLRPSVMSAEPSQNTRGLENAASSKDFRIPSGKIQSSPYIASAGAGGAFDAKSSGPVSVNIDGIVTAPFPEKSAASPPVAPPPPPAPAPRPPPLPKGVRPPPPPGRLKPLPLKGAPGGSNVSKGGDNSKSDSEVPKAKLKPFFWDKVQAKDDQSMVWHELKAGSFQVNEEMMESLFGYAPMDKNNVERKKESPSLDNVPQYVKLIDPKKAQNLSILLRALNVTTEEVCNALQEGNELPAELIQTLIKMVPSSNEELKLRLYDGELSQLGPAERFLKQLVEIPHSVKRLESLLLMSTYPEEIANIKESHETLEVACHKLRNSRLFLKLLEAVLKTGNRMNDGTYRGGAQAFKLDTLLKLSDVKGTDGKTTLLHFVVQEMIRSEGIRAVRIARESLGDESSEKTEEYFKSLGLQVVSGLSTELEDVKKAAVIDADGITCSVSKLGHSLVNTREFLNTKMKNLDEDSQSQFVRKLATFVELAEAEIPHHIEEEKRIIALIKSTADYFHGNPGKEEGLRLFIIVRDFLIMLDKVCKEIQHSLTKPQPPRKQGSTSSTEAHQPHTQLSDVPQRLFPAIQERRTDDSSSDDDSS